MNRKIELFMSIALLCCAVFLAKEGALYMLRNGHTSNFTKQNSPFSQKDCPTETDSTEQPESDVEPNTICIVIDAGHGGNDPGKIGVNGSLEKDINLAIALQLKESLEEKNLTIILTRTDDSNLANGVTNNQKRADMQNRCQIITDANPVFTISIHQNSYPSPEIDGAQVFYYTDSNEGRALATTLQTALKEQLDPTNRRQPKANDSYYLLKKTPTPTVIVECGFLSNPSEANLLVTSEYQQKVVDAITSGILTYLQENNYL